MSQKYRQIFLSQKHNRCSNRNSRRNFCDRNNNIHSCDWHRVNTYVSEIEPETHVVKMETELHVPVAMLEHKQKNFGRCFHEKHQYVKLLEFVLHTTLCDSKQPDGN